jgi:hypothetical protein
MSKSAKIETKLTGDSTGLKRELNLSKNEVAKFARDVTARLKAIQVATQSINIIASIAGFVGMAKQAISLYKDLKNWINGTSDAAKQAAAAAAEAGRKLSDAAQKNGFSPAEFAAITEAAARAKIPADELADILAKIAEKKGGIQEVADALGTTADNLRRAADAANAAVTGRRYAAQAESREKEAADAEAGRKADATGYARMARDLLAVNGQDFGRIVADVVRAANGDKSVLDYIASNLMYESRGARGVVRAAMGKQRDVNFVMRSLYSAFDEDEVARSKAAESARQADLVARLQQGVTEYNPYEAYADEQKRKAAADAAAQKAAELTARRNEKQDEIMEQLGALVEKRDADIAAITVSAPQAINSLNSIGGLIGSDPTALNAARMDAERNAKLSDIQKKFDEANAKLQEALDALQGG